jgi:hypothetical protein
VFFQVTTLCGFIIPIMSTSCAKNGVVGVFSTMFSIHKTFSILAQFHFQRVKKKTMKSNKRTTKEAILNPSLHIGSPNLELHFWAWTN